MEDFEQKNTNKNLEKKDLFNSSQRDLSSSKQMNKRVFGFFVLLVFMALGLGIWQISNNISSPFAPTEQNNINSANQLAFTTNTETPRVENLRELDTDLDEINDYDELYLYNTSPYIADSDSDGISDSLEIEQGTDPNCPEGVNCGRQIFTNTNSALTEEEIGQLSIEDLRNILSDSGAPEDFLNNLSDDDLVDAYNEVLKTESTDTDTDTNSDSLQPETIDYDTLFGLDADGIRELLVQGGVPAESIEGIDGETLIQIYQEALSENIDETSQ